MTRGRIALALAGVLLAAGCAGQPHFSKTCGPNPVDAAIANWTPEGGYPTTADELDRYEACLARVYKERTGEDIEVLMDRLFPDGY